MPLDPSARVWPFGFSRIFPVSVERKYRTTIFNSESGREQRRAVDDRPRKRIRFGIIAAGDCYRAFTREMSKYQSALYALPDWTRKTLATTVLAGAGNSLDVASAENWLVAGETVIIASQGRFERYTIDTFVDPTLTFIESNAGSDFPIGSRLYAAVPARLSASEKAKRPIRDVLTHNLTFNIAPTDELYIEPGVAPVIFNGREVLAKAPHRIAPIDHTFITGIEEVDYGFGAKARFKPVDFPSEIYSLTYTSCNVAKATELEDIFVRARGRRGEFYMPTWENDLIPNSTAAMGTTTLPIIGDDVADVYGGSSVFKAIAVHFTDNTFEFNTVTNVTPGAGVSTLTVGTAWSRDIDAALIRRISWMPVCRFATDQLTTEWPIDRVGRMRMAVQTLEDLP